MTPQDPLGDFIDRKLAEQRGRDLLGLGGAGSIRLGDGGRGPRLGGPTGNLAYETQQPGQDDWQFAHNNGVPPRAGMTWTDDCWQYINGNSPGGYRANATLALYGGSVGEKAAEKSAEQVLRRAAEQAAGRAPEAAQKVAPFLEGAAPWLGRLSAGVGLFFHMEDARTTDWTAAGSKFSYNPDDRYAQVTDGEAGTHVPIPGISNPSQHSGAQYLSYVSYKSNGGALAIDDYVSFDPPDMGPIERTSGLGSSSRARSQKPEWLQWLQEGTAFNDERRGVYEFDEVCVNKSSGKGYFRVDSYNPRTEEIVSRKFTQFSAITEETGIDYVKEMAAKYPNGAVIADVPTNRENGLAGKLLTGGHVLEVPVQIRPIPRAVLDEAYRFDVIIRDIKGKTY